ncbi:endothelial cell-specific chemotaxis regulator [Amazona ochrocephala]
MARFPLHRQAMSHILSNHNGLKNTVPLWIQPVSFYSLTGSSARVSPGRQIAPSPSCPSRDGQSLSSAAQPQATEKMLAPSIHPLLWLFGCVLFRGTSASTESSVQAVTGQSQSTTNSPEVKNHTSEPSVKSTPPPDLNLTSVGPTTTAESSSFMTTLLTSTVQGKHGKFSLKKTCSGQHKVFCTSKPLSDLLQRKQGQEPTRSKSTTTSVTQGASSTLSQGGTSNPATPTPMSSGYLPVPTPTDDKSPLTVAAFGVISFIVILIVVVIILVSVVSLRFKCNRSKDSEDKQKPGTSMVSESCSAGTSQKDNSITLISMKNINMNNSMSYPPSEKVSLLSLAF